MEELGIWGIVDTLSNLYSGWQARELTSSPERRRHSHYSHQYIREQVPRQWGDGKTASHPKGSCCRLHTNSAWWRAAECWPAAERWPCWHRWKRCVCCWAAGCRSCATCRSHAPELHLTAGGGEPASAQSYNSALSPETEKVRLQHSSIQSLKHHQPATHSHVPPRCHMAR